MHLLKYITILFFTVLCFAFRSKPNDPQKEYTYTPDQIDIYKTIDSINLHLEVFYPDKHKHKKNLPSYFIMVEDGNMVQSISLPLMPNIMQKKDLLLF